MMKAKLLVTGALIAALAVTPHTMVRAQTKPNWIIPVVCGCIVIGIGAWVTYELYQVCKKIPDPKPQDQQDPPPPPAAQVVAPATNTPSSTMRLDDSSGVLYWDASGYGWTDPMSGQPITAIMKTRLQSTRDFQTWAEAVSILGYCSSSGTTLVLSRGGVPVCTNYVAAGATNYVQLDPAGMLAPCKFYRLSTP